MTLSYKADYDYSNLMYGIHNIIREILQSFCDGWDKAPGYILFPPHSSFVQELGLRYGKTYGQALLLELEESVVFSTTK